MTDIYKNPLWISFIEVGDYFARLGGSARFHGFYEWYCPALVLMCLLGLKAPKEAFTEVKLESEISERLWAETNGLPTDITAKLSQLTINKADIDQFIAEVTKLIEKNIEPRPELRHWQRFVESFRANSANLH